MEYLVDGSRFSLSYAELRSEYRRFVDMPDEQFLSQLPAAIHLACFICFLKEVPTDCCLSDKGIVHELVHLLHIPGGNTTTLSQIRQLFGEQLRLA